MEDMMIPVQGEDEDDIDFHNRLSLRQGIRFCQAFFSPFDILGGRRIIHRSPADQGIEGQCESGRRRAPGQVRLADATKSDISEAAVLLLYLLPESQELLVPIFERDLKPGTPILTHNDMIPGWEKRKTWPAIRRGPD
jgi:hypothetical protein